MNLAEYSSYIHAETAAVDAILTRAVDTVLAREEKIQKLFKEYRELKRQIGFDKSYLQEALEQDPDYSAAKEQAAIATKKKKVAKQRVEAREVDICTQLSELQADLADTEYALGEMITFEVICRAKTSDPNPMQMSLFDTDGTAYKPVFSVRFALGDKENRKESQDVSGGGKEEEPST